MLGDNENENTDEVVGLRVERRTCEHDVEYRGGKHGALDSGAGSTSSRQDLKRFCWQPRDRRLRMSAANGSTLENLRRLFCASSSRHVSLKSAVENPRGVKIGVRVHGDSS